MLPTGRPCSCATNVHRVSEFTYRTKTDKIVHIVHISTPTPGCNSILLHSGLNPAWNFWLSTRFSCLEMKSVENILGYILEAVSLEKMFEIFQENIQNWFIFKQQKNYATRFVVAFWVIDISTLECERNILLSSSRAFSLSTVTFLLSTPLENSEATWKKLQDATNLLTYHQPLFRTHTYKTLLTLHTINVFVLCIAYNMDLHTS